MRTINDGKGITLHLSFEEAAIITEALREASTNDKRVRKIVENMLNKQEVIVDD